MFLIFHGLDKANGISKKISYQVQALQACNLDVQFCRYYITSEGERGWKINDLILNRWKNSIWSKIKKRVLYAPLINYVQSENISFIYIRYDHNANPFTIHLIKTFKKKGIKVVLEIPTYPYDKEYEGFKMNCELFVDRLFRRNLVKHLDKIVTFSDDPFIFGKQTIRISNGIDFAAIKLKEKKNDSSSCLNLIGVAEIHYWHGFDRLLKGLEIYYRNNPSYKVFFHIVGSPSGKREEREVVDFIKEKHLEKYAIMHGRKHGEELSKLFEQADMGVGSLARHRTGIDKIKPLKNREYAARGIPFMYSETDDDFERMPYVYKVSADERPINIDQLISFYKEINLSSLQIRNSILNLSWEMQMKKVLQDLSLLSETTK